MDDYKSRQTEATSPLSWAGPEKVREFLLCLLIFHPVNYLSVVAGYFKFFEELLIHARAASAVEEVADDYGSKPSEHQTKDTPKPQT